MIELLVGVIVMVSAVVLSGGRRSPARCSSSAAGLILLGATTPVESKP